MFGLFEANALLCMCRLVALMASLLLSPVRSVWGRSCCSATRSIVDLMIRRWQLKTGLKHSTLKLCLSSTTLKARDWCLLYVCYLISFLLIIIIQTVFVTDVKCRPTVQHIVCIFNPVITWPFRWKPGRVITPCHIWPFIQKLLMGYDSYLAAKAVMCTGIGGLQYEQTNGLTWLNTILFSGTMGSCTTVKRVNSFFSWNWITCCLVEKVLFGRLMVKLMKMRCSVNLQQFLTANSFLLISVWYILFHVK